MLMVSCSSVEREEVDIEEEDGVQQEGLLVSQFLLGQQGSCTVGCPHHPQTLGWGRTMHDIVQPLLVPSP